jgi:uncharacterized protein YoxC
MSVDPIMSDQPLGRETDWLFHRLNTLEEKIDAQHSRLRGDMTTNFDKLSASVKDMFDRCDTRISINTTRLTVIETERTVEARQAVKRGTAAGAIAATGLTVVAEAVKHLFGLR